MKEAGKNQSYLNVCCNLRLKLPSFVSQAGYLLSERALCAKLSTSRETLRKALFQLRSEGLIYREGRRNLVNTYQENHDIGILTDSFQRAPYLGDPCLFAGIMEAMEATKYNSRLLVPNDTNAIPDLVKRYNLKGLLWLDPPKSSLLRITKMFNAIKIASIILHYELDVDTPLKCNYVTIDRAYHGKQRARFFIEKGYDKVLYLGEADSTYSAFMKEMSVHGQEQSEEWILDKPAQVSESLIRRIEQEKFQGIISNGGMYARCLITTLAKAENVSDMNLCIQLPYDRSIGQLLSEHPTIKIAKFDIIDQKEYGRKGLEMLVQQIEKGADQEPVFVLPRLVDYGELPAFLR